MDATGYWNLKTTNSSKAIRLTIFFVAVVVRVCVAVLVAVCFGQSCDIGWRFSCRFIQKLLQLLLIHLTSRS